MNLFKTLAAAGLAVVAVAGVSTSADAQSYRHRDGYYGQRHHGWNNHHRGWDRGRHYGWNRHRICRTVWRHHHRTTVCRRAF